MLFVRNLPRLNRHQRARIERAHTTATPTPTPTPSERANYPTDEVIADCCSTSDPYGDAPYLLLNNSNDYDEGCSDYNPEEADCIANGLTIIEPDNVLDAVRFLNGYHIE